MKATILAICIVFLQAIVACKKPSTVPSGPDINTEKTADLPPLAQQQTPKEVKQASVVARPIQKIETLEEGCKSQWTRITVALGADDGCTGLQRQHELVIQRNSSKMTIQGRERISDSKTVETPQISLSEEELDGIVNKLNSFNRLASSEIDPGEQFSSLSPAEKRKEMENSNRYGGFGGIFFCVEFEADETRMMIQNAFKETSSVETYLDWIRVWRNTCRQ